ncbi:sensor histidine kinase [Ornithobacterium rhinotracheale]|uniref:sensor histidine kinase n=1 Tax=Ornithobacterium rhinotracheale TaxID=28251 RepID=UPI001FF2CD3C|nr:ATP-binding protein [Ornithobacterium rhinotracheale]MCK0202392.1 ATP-binding protein [Ornithobacterium rhinotracheale]MCK0205481.1 ATP-binding protein [Ornithobacterium rhinotracheale]
MKKGFKFIISFVLSSIYMLMFYFGNSSICEEKEKVFFGVVFYFALFIGNYLLISYVENQDVLKAHSTKENLSTKTIAEKLEKEKKELDTLYERENYRREFVGNVAHELKTPLFSIQGYLLTLIEGGVDDESIRDKYLHRINKSVERLTYIVKDLDLITELESGNLKLNIYPFNIVALVQEVFELLEIKAENNDVKLGFDKSYDEPIKVSGDIEKIEQVLMNLIVNAINHSQRACKVKVSFQVVKDLVKISVSDTGMGIKPEEMKRIFERFYRADKSRSRQQGGSGLGLAIVKHILEAHDQKISAESTYGKGTTFSFYLERA